MAKKSGVSLGTIGNYLKDCSSAKISNLQKIAETGGRTFEWLVTGRDLMNDSQNKTSRSEFDAELYSKAADEVDAAIAAVTTDTEGRVVLQEDRHRLTLEAYKRLLKLKEKNIIVE